MGENSHEQDYGTQSESRKQKSLAKILTLSIGLPLLFFAAIAAAALTNVGTPQWFIDKFTYANYSPSDEIASLVEESGMNDLGEFYFYAGEPSLDDADQFNINCAELLNEESNVLGCYDGNIYLFNVVDERIEGVKNVTAAHEMLHVAYDRLGAFDKIYIDGLIEKELRKTDDPNILELVELYADLEPGQEINELHSIFGTESVELSPELEKYYARYFGDRSKVIDRNNQYKAVFEQMEAQAEELEAKMDVLEKEIDILQSKYLVDAGQLSRDIDNFNSRASSVSGFGSEYAFNVERNNLIARQNTLSGQLDYINEKIDEYNTYVEDLRVLGRDADVLSGKLNSQNEIIE